MAQIHVLHPEHVKPLKTVLQEEHAYSGRSRLSLLLDMYYSYYRWSVNAECYQQLGFSRLSARQRNTYVTFALHRRLDRENQEIYKCLVSDKYEFSLRFQKYFGRKLLRTRDLTVQSLEAFVAGQEKILYKSLNSARTEGTEVLIPKDFPSAEALLAHVRKLPEGTVEHWIHQHPILNRISPRAVIPIRIITRKTADGYQKLGCCVTISTERDIANNCMLDWIVRLDPETGKLRGPMYTRDFRVADINPFTGELIDGFQIPYWNELTQMLNKAVEEVPQLPYLGWDLCISEDGPLIIEANTQPGYLACQNRVVTPDGHGLLDQYLPEKAHILSTS